MKRIRLFFVLLLTLTSFFANAQTWNEIVKVCAGDRAANDTYSYSIAISGDYAVVGAPDEDEDASGGATLAGAGSAYILYNNAGTWTQVQKICASDRAASDNFGRSVDIDGDYIIVGAYNEDENATGSGTLVSSGSAYIFHNTAGTWSQVQKICASDRAANDFFGFSVSISGNYAIVGAQQEDEDAAGANTMSMAGSAYIFLNTAGTWAQVQKIVANDRAAADSYGYSVSISGDYAIVGAYQEDENAAGGANLPEAGSSYIYYNNAGTWIHDQKIVPPSRATQDYFGYAVDISGDYLIVGAYNEDEDASEANTMVAAGSAYIFYNNAGTWTIANKLVASDRLAADRFGYAVAICNDYALVGAYYEDEDAAGSNTFSGAGSAYVFHNNAGNWSQSQKIVPSDRAMGDYFGFTVALTSSSLMVGAYAEDHDAAGLNLMTSSGSVYMFAPAGAEMNVKQNLTNIADGGSYDFGNIVSGSSSGAITFTIENLGAADLTLSGTPKIVISGADASYFVVNQSSVTSPVVPAGSTTFTITFNPTAVISYSAQISISNDDSDESPYNFIINGTGAKIPQTITDFNAITTKTYGDGPFVVSANATSGLAVVFTSSDPTVATCTGTNGTTVTILKAGTCDIRANQAGNATYDVAPQVVQTLTVNTKTITVSAEAKSKFYGDADPPFTYTYTPALVGSDVFTGSLTRIGGECGGCVFQIQQGSLSLGANYTIIYVPEDLTTNKRPITVTANAGQSKVYGASNPASYTYTYTGTLVGADSFAGGLTRVAGETVGNYAIEQGTLALTANYIITFVSDNFSITAKPITVTANSSQTKVYGSADPASYSYTVTGTLVGGDSFSGALTRVVGENVGNYEIQQGSLALSANYAITYVPANFSITAKAITLTVYAGQSKTYGDSDPTYTYWLAGTLVGGDTYSGSMTRVAGENVGTYAIQQGTFTYGSNYILTFVGANFSITVKPIVVTATAGQTKVYGDSDPVFAYTFSSPLVGGDSFTGALTRVAGENFGTYAIQQGTLALSSNYFLSYTGANFSITKKPITVTADAGQTKVYGDANPGSYTYSVTGTLVGGDSFSGALTRIVGENVGNYTIQQGSLALSTNYILTYVSANFGITAKSITVTADAGQTKVYGDANPGSYTYSVTGSLVGGDSFSGALTRLAGENVGTYAIQQGSLSLSSNYSLNYVGANFSITSKSITVTANAGQSKIYGESNPVYTYSVIGSLVGGDSFLGALSRVSGEDVGLYLIQQGTLSLSANYTLTFVGDDFNITAKPITVTADPDQSKTFGQVDPVFTYSLSTSLIGGDSFTGALTREPGEAVGFYEILQGTLALNSNYNISYVSADFEIVEIPANTIIVTADPNQSKIYGESDPASFTYTYVGTIAPEDSFTGSLTRVAGENAGLYEIQQGSLALPGGYILIYEEADFEILKAIPVITWANPADIYNNEALSATQLNATANVTGTFSYSPDFGAFMSVGNNQELNVEFLPEDDANYNDIIATVYINVLLYVGTPEFSEEGINVYPNPTKGIVNLDFSNNEVQNIRITDISGKLIFEKSVVLLNETLDLSMNPAGVYFVTIQTNDKVFTSKIVLQ